MQSAHSIPTHPWTVVSVVSRAAERVRGHFAQGRQDSKRQLQLNGMHGGASGGGVYIALPKLFLIDIVNWKMSNVQIPVEIYFNEMY